MEYQQCSQKRFLHSFRLFSFTGNNQLFYLDFALLAQPLRYIVPVAYIPWLFETQHYCAVTEFKSDQKRIQLVEYLLLVFLFPLVRGQF